MDEPEKDRKEILKVKIVVWVILIICLGGVVFSSVYTSLTEITITLLFVFIFSVIGAALAGCFICLIRNIEKISKK